MRTTRPKPLAVMASLLMAGVLAFGSVAAPAAAVETSPAELAEPQDSAKKNSKQIIDMFNGVNKFRKSKGLPPLRIGSNVSIVTQEWSTHMAKLGLLEHSTSYATDPRIDSGWIEAGENIAMNWTGTGQSMVDQWIASPGHNENMSKRETDVMGIGIAFDGQGRMWGTNTFYDYPTALPKKTYATAEAYLADIKPEPKPIFKDVPNGAAFATEIRWMANRGITTGWPDGTFRPLDTVRRDAMAAFLYRLANSPAHSPAKKSPFKDVSTGQQFYKEMTWLAGTGITTGWPDGTFRSGAPVNRDAMAAFLFRLAGSPDYYTPPKVSRFTDVSTKNQFYKEISWLADQGISTGWVNNHTGTRTFAPSQPVNRDAMAAFMYRFDQQGWIEHRDW